MNLEKYKSGDEPPLYYEMDDPLIARDENGIYWTAGRGKGGVPVKIKNPQLGLILEQLQPTTTNQIK